MGAGKGQTKRTNTSPGALTPADPAKYNSIQKAFDNQIVTISIAGWEEFSSFLKPGSFYYPFSEYYLPDHKRGDKLNDKQRGFILTETFHDILDNGLIEDDQINSSRPIMDWTDHTDHLKKLNYKDYSITVRTGKNGTLVKLFDKKKELSAMGYNFPLDVTANMYYNDYDDNHPIRVIRDLFHEATVPRL